MKTIRIVRKKVYKIANIILLRSEQNYTHIYFKNGRQLTVARTLKAMESEFTNFGFFRTHKSYIVNPNHILQYLDGDAEVCLSENHKASVSRRRRVAFEKTLLAS